MSSQDGQKNLSTLYTETILHQSAYVERLQEAFDKRCKEIGAQTKAKLENAGNDEEAKQAIQAEEKATLNQALDELRYALSESGAEVREKLEKIQNKIDDGKMNLEEELNQL